TRTLTVKTGSLPTKAAAEIGTASPLRVRVRRPRGARIVRVDAYVGKRRVLRVRRNGIRTVTLRSRPAGAFRLKLVARTANGRRVTTVRRLGPCA
ncbi:MAG: hypothetical protein ACJ77M_08425, partial [Thermoleophilaceae bacterium]